MLCLHRAAVLRTHLCCLFVPVFWGAPHSFCPEAEKITIWKVFFRRGPTSPKMSSSLWTQLSWGPGWGMVRFKSRPLQQTELWRLMPWVFHKGWGRLEEGGEGGREGRRRGMRVWEFEIAFFFLSIFSFCSGPAYLWCHSHGKKTEKENNRAASLSFPSSTMSVLVLYIEEESELSEMKQDLLEFRSVCAESGGTGTNYFDPSFFHYNPQFPSFFGFSPFLFYCYLTR